MAKKDSDWGDLDGLSGEVDNDYNPFDKVLDTDSPSFNWILGNNHGLPLGYSLVLIGPAKGGKTLIANNFIAKLHRDDPEARVVKFDTELRSSASNKTAMVTGIDPTRLKIWETNVPDEIFDRIEKNIAAWQQANDNKIKLIVIDSLSMIGGRRTLNSDTVNQQQIGDEAATLTTGIKRILPVLRRYKMALICTVHIRSQLDKVELMRGQTVRAQMPHMVKHTMEYYVFVEQNQTKDGRVIDENSKDMKDNNLQTGHRIYAKCTENSFGAKNRVAEFELSYRNGMINIGAEVAELGKKLGIIQMPNNRTSIFDGQQWSSRAMLEEALESDLELRQRVITAIKRTDLNITRL